jgi:hypothetical protein
VTEQGRKGNKRKLELCGHLKIVTKRGRKGNKRKLELCGHLNSDKTRQEGRQKKTGVMGSLK